MEQEKKLPLLRRELRPDYSEFEWIKQTLLSLLGNTEEARNIILACEEVFTNIVRYSEADSVAFSCAKTEDLLTVVYADNGIPFDPTVSPIPEKEFEDLDTGGMGLMLERLYSKEMKYERRNGKNVLTILF